MEASRALLPLKLVTFWLLQVKKQYQTGVAKITSNVQELCVFCGNEQAEVSVLMFSIGGQLFFQKTYNKLKDRYQN